MHLTHSRDWLIHAQKIEGDWIKALQEFASALAGDVVLVYREILAFRSRRWFWPVVSAGVLCTGTVSAFMLSLPDVRSPAVWVAPGSIAVKDRNGKGMYFAYDTEDRSVLTAEEIPDTVKNAFIAIEDERFWDRTCIDWRALTRAALANATSYKSQGASTITQQLVRRVLLTREKNFVRKFKELTLACELEHTLSKEEILTHYLNWISLGGVTAGVQQASRHYFGKDIGNVTLAQAAVLASLVQRPSYYSPYGPHRYTQMTASGVLIGLTGTGAISGGRAHQVLANMYEQGYIDEQTKIRADKDLLTLRFRDDVRSIEAPHYVLGMLGDLKKTLPPDALNDQLSVVTTIDSALQETAERLAEEHALRIAKKYKAHSVAIVLADTRTHEILAYVGNVGFFGTGTGAKIDMVVSPRQPGSSFKPIVYAASMQYAGWTPTTTMWDTPLVIGGASPQNYGGNFEGRLPLIVALNHSRNIPAIRAFKAVGEDPILRLAADLGAPTPLAVRTAAAKNGHPFDYNWPLAIGAAEVPLLEMVQAYTTFANSGIYRPLRGVKAVEDAAGHAYTPEVVSGLQAVPAEIADNITAMLSESRSRPEGFWRTITDIPGMDEAVKTGTSNVCLERGKTFCKKMLPRDVWAIGYTPAYIVGVWMGNVDGSPLTANADGLNAAVPLWKDMLVAAHESSLAKNAPRTFAGTRAPYYTQHPNARPKAPLAPSAEVAQEPSWFLTGGNRAILSRRN